MASFLPQGLNSESTLAVLPRFEHAFERSTGTLAIERLFTEAPALPGIIITDAGGFVSVASRGWFMQTLGRPFGRELFLHRSIGEMLENVRAMNLVLPASMTVHEASSLALARPMVERYEPIAVECGTRQWGLIDVAIVLQAQSAILAEEIKSHRQAARQAKQAEERFRGIFENAIEGIFEASLAGAYVRVNPALARIHGFDTPEELLSFVTTRSAEVFIEPERREEFFSRVVRERAVRAYETRIRRPDGAVIWIHCQARTVRDAAGVPIYVEGAIEDVTLRKETERERERLQQTAMNASRHAGMAEVATGVLHNVGNVLNSVAVSTNLLAERLRRSKVPNLGKATAMLAEHQHCLGEYLSQDERGRALPGYLIKLADFLTQEQAGLMQEIDGLGKSVEHIKEIVAAQQSFAKVSAVRQQVDLAELLEEALRINSVSFERHSIEVVRAFRPGAVLAGDKHLIMQVLINLISNAKRAVRDSGKPERRVILRIPETRDGDPLSVEVEDNGVGISPEHLPRIFQHGFTTRDDGHGFGLHNSANIAQQLGGQLTARSAGAGLGALFTLTLPTRLPSETTQC